MSDVVAAWQEVSRRIDEACVRSGRTRNEVLLLAVSKFFPASAIEPLIQAGQLDFGESRVQELVEKVPVLSEAVRWHFIGALQKNKINKALPHLHMLHSLDSTDLADALQLRIQGASLPILIQVNQGDELQKGGVLPGQSAQLLIHILEHCPGLIPMGLMTIPPAGELPRRYFAELRSLREKLEAESGVKLPNLSMGMSGDFEQAIEEGATMVRVGSTIFGARASGSNA